MTLGAIIVVVVSLVTHAHDVTTNVTWNREVSRIFYARCATCHRPGGSAFSLMSYQEASPWARGIKDAVLTRSMPPWGAVKGFGSFRNDQALTQEEIDLVERWVNGGSPEGNPNDLPATAKDRSAAGRRVPDGRACCLRRLQAAAAIRARWIRRSCPPERRNGPDHD